MRKTQIRCHAFTLVELLAAMAVFSVLLLVSMQIFSGAQNIWVAAEKKNNVFSDARKAMEFLTSRIDTVHCGQDILFQIENDTRNGGKWTSLRQNIYFATMMPMARKRSNGRDSLDANSLRFLSFQVVDDDTNNPSGALKMMILSDHDPAYDTASSGLHVDMNFEYLLPPYENESVTFSSLKLYGGSTHTVTTTRQNVFSAIRTNLNAKADDADPEGHYPKDVVVLAENVARLRFNAYNVDLSAAGRSRHKKKDFLQNLAKDSTNPIVALPYLLEIELTVFDTKEHYQQWYNAAGDAEKKLLLEQYSYTFNRSLLFGDRM